MAGLVMQGTGQAPGKGSAVGNVNNAGSSVFDMLTSAAKPKKEKANKATVVSWQDDGSGNYIAKAPTATSATTKTTPTTGPTYKDFTKAAKAAGFKGSFDANDLDFAKKYPEFGLSLIKLKQDLANATTNEQRLLATEAMNQLRKNYGSYWTGDEGDRSYAASYGSKINNALDEIGGYGPFEFSEDDRYRDLLNKVTDFNYDPTTDPAYASYKKQYNREGDRAAANALATSAAATGGNPSSYAVSAASQAGNYYASKLADVIPQLREQAMTELLQGLGALDTQRGQEYTEYNDTYSRLNQNLKNLQGQDEIDYKRYLDMVNAEYKKQRDEVADKQQEWNNAWAIYQKTGKITGPLKKVIKKPKATASSGDNGSGGSPGDSGSGSGGAPAKKTGTEKSYTKTPTTPTTTTKTSGLGEGDDTIKLPAGNITSVTRRI